MKRTEKGTSLILTDWVKGRRAGQAHIMGTVGNNFNSDLRKCPIVCDCALKSASDESDVYDANGDRTQTGAA